MGRIKSRTAVPGRARVALLALAIVTPAVAEERAWAASDARLPPAARATAEVPPFVIFGWVSPPVDSTTPERIAEMAGAGMTLLLHPEADQGRVEDNLRRLDLAAANGLIAMLWDGRFNHLDTATVEGRARLDSIVADYRGHPAFFGYYLGDEPPPERLPLLDSLFTALRWRDPRHPAWNNLLGRGVYPDRAAYEAALRHYVATIEPAVLAMDHYDFLESGDRGQFVESVAGIGTVAREHGIPFWCTIQLVEHLAFRALTPGELRWQVGQSLAYGARGIGYFTWWTPSADPTADWQPAIIGPDGRRTAWFETVRALNAHLGPTGEALAALAWQSTTHAGSVPIGAGPFVPGGGVARVEGRAAIGRFVDPAGRRHLMVAASDSLAPSRIVLELVSAGAAEWLDPVTHDWSVLAGTRRGDTLVVTLELEPGGFALLRIHPHAESHPTIEARPNPARGSVELSFADTTPGDRLEILDPAGRCAWSVRLDSTSGRVVWLGATQGREGKVKPGLYFARLSGRAGVAVARVVWLGAR